MILRAVLGLFFVLFLNACGNEPHSPAKTAQNGDPKKGKAVYLANCAACHNSDPSKDGPIAPPVKGSSRELVEARVLRAAYPPGYTPKRKSTAMPPQPYLKSAIPDLAAFLGSSG